jgi:Mg-chelatase subunit ChlD
MKDYASALEENLKNLLENEDATLEGDEKAYRPYTTENDKVSVVGGNEEAGKQALARVTRSTRKETSYLRSKLRTMFRALEDGARLHGVRKGRNLSERYLVDTFANIRGGQDPTRAFHEDTETIDVSIASVIVIDESGSMSSKLTETAQILYTLGDALDSIGAKFSMIGFRDGGHHANIDYTERNRLAEQGWTRTSSVTFDVFKSFEDRFKTVAWKVGNVKATGGTPMADGVELALSMLSNRREGHRVMFVVTDGCPDYGHSEIIKSQVRRAREAGIVVIGVGLGGGSEHVQTTFPDSVFSFTLQEIPNLLVTKLGEMVRTIGSRKRGTKVKAA